MLKFYIYSFFIFQLSLGCGSAQQQFGSHRVQQGETVYSIAKQYGTSEANLLRLNPDARGGLKLNSLLIVPEGKQAEVTSQIKLKEHIVKRRETLYGIAQLYNISVEDIKKQNKELYSRELRNGEKLQIPTVLIEKNVEVPAIVTVTKKHNVQAKETKFGIARKYGITISQLESLNPEMGEDLKVGDILNVPETSVVESAVIDDENFEFYEVKAKEGFFRLKVNFDLSEEEIVALNPFAKDGLKEGMILKIPKTIAVVSLENVSPLNLEKRIINKKRKNLVVMLPFDMNRTLDSTQTEEGMLKQDPTLRVALDFYSGMLMATEFAKDKGISVKVDVYDTEKSESKVASIISSKNFKDVDAVIGPLLQKNVEKAAELLENSKVPVFSPLSNRDMKMFDNLFQTLPTPAVLEQTMIRYFLENGSGKNLILISDAKRNAQKEKLMAAFPGIKLVAPRGGGYIQSADVTAVAQEGMENWVILESDNPVLLSSVVSVLNGMVKSHRARLFTLDKNDAYDYQEVSNARLARLQFTFPSVNKSTDEDTREAFAISYKNKYGVAPNRYATRGFDVTYDVLLRLASTDETAFEAVLPENETVYIENKFHYTKSPSKGYINQAAYILKYNSELEFEVVE